MNRQVTKGASAYYIQRPILIKTGEKDEETGEEKKIQRFKPVKSVFPVSMTEGEPLPELELPEWSRTRMLGALSIREVAFESFDGNKQGYSIGRDLAVNPAAKYPEKTFFHEAGHITLGHTEPGSYEEYKQHRGRKEVAAEAVSHLVMNELGLMTPEMASVSRAYIQSWGKDVKLEDQEVRAIFKATDLVIESGREKKDE
ncbi:hypothetical protein GS464_29545 [Rhodococcus hoagii]|nr:hypothetical protein [Prescottella equi]